ASLARRDDDGILLSAFEEEQRRERRRWPARRRRNLRTGALQAPWHLEAEDGDEVTLHLVGAAAEGEDQRALIRAFQAAPDQGTRRAPLQGAGRSHDFEQQPVGLAAELGDEHVGGRGLGYIP